MVNINWNMRYKNGKQPIVRINEKTKEEFRERTTKGKLASIWETKDTSIETKYTQWNERVKEIAENVFTVVKKKKKEMKEVRLLRGKKKDITRKIKDATEEEKALYIKRKKLIEGHINHLKKEEEKRKAVRLASMIKKEKGFDGNAFWEYKKRNQGRKKEAMSSIKDKDGKLEEDPEKILEIYRSFYKNLLSGKRMQTKEGEDIEAGVEKYIEAMEMRARKERIEPFSEEEYEKVKKELKTGKAADLQGWRYEMITNAGKDMDESMLKMVNEVVPNQVVPEEWIEMVIKSISKGKGDLKSMDSKRGLFLTNIVSKIVEKLIKNRNKGTVEMNMSPFQCGGVRNRGICDNLLIVNSAIEECRTRKENIFLLFADLEKCFDQLWLKDCIKEIHEAGMPAGEAAYIYKMNKEVTAIVETPIGKTNKFKLEEIVRQGTVMAVDLCGVNTDKINKIGNEEPELTVSGVGVRYPVFVDDMVAIGTKDMIEKMGRKMKFLEESKKFTFNNGKGKSEILKIRTSKRKDAEDDNPTVKVRKGEIGYAEKYKYLGDQYDETGRNMSKIEKKMEKVKHIANEVKRSTSYKEVGEADTGVRMMLMETVVKPTLLFNTETWISLTNKEWEKINNAQYRTLIIIFEQKESTPYYGIIAETGIWPYSYVVIYKRLMLFHHLINSHERRIARRMVVNQMEMKGNETWYEGVRWWIDKLKLESKVEDIQKITKSQWKRKVKKGIEEVITEEIRNKVETMKKLRFIKKIGKKQYLERCEMAVVKEIMRIRLNMVEVKMNFKGKYKDTKCPACGEEDETTEHVLQCKEYRRLVGHTVEIDDERKNFEETEWLIEASRAYKAIEETRKWLV